MTHGHISADALWEIAKPARGVISPDVAESLRAGGWDPDKPALLDCPRHRPAGVDGTRRLRWMVENGRGAELVPVVVRRR